MDLSKSAAIVAVRKLALAVARPITSVALAKSAAIVVVRQLALAQAITSVVMANCAAAATAKLVAPMLD